jgi:hypothetical protein
MPVCAPPALECWNGNARSEMNRQAVQSRVSSFASCSVSFFSASLARPIVLSRGRTWRLIGARARDGRFFAMVVRDLLLAGLIGGGRALTICSHARGRCGGLSEGGWGDATIPSPAFVVSRRAIECTRTSSKSASRWNSCPRSAAISRAAFQKYASSFRSGAVGFEYQIKSISEPDVRVVRESEFRELLVSCAYE